MSSTSPPPRTSSVLKRSLWPATIRPRLARLLHRTSRVEIDAVYAAANMPPEIETVIRTTIRRARLWKSEQFDVARELCSHFADGLAAERSSDQLIADFGNPAASARLIRRAKRRNRPLWWRTWRMGLRGVGVFILLVIGLYGVLAVRYFTGRPTIAHDYFAQLNVPLAAIPEADRAWPLYKQALIELEPLPPDPAGLTAGSSLSTPQPGHPDWPAMRDYLHRNRQVIDLLHLATTKPAMGATLDSAEATELAATLASRHQAGPPAPTPITPARAPADPASDGLFAIQLIPVGHARTLARLLRADMDLAVEDGDSAQAAAAAGAMFAFADHLREQQFLITELVAEVVDATAFEAVKRTLMIKPQLLPTDDLIDLAHTLDSAPLPDERLARSLESERLGFLDVMQRLYTDDGRGDGRLTAAGMRNFSRLLDPYGDNQELNDFASAPLGPVTAGAAVGRRRAIALYDQVIADTALMLRTPRWRRDPMKSPDLRLIEQTEGLFNAARYWPTRMLVPALGSLARSADLHRVQRDSVLVAIALELYRREHGGYPQSLNDLTPRLLPTLPLDIIDGQPLRYRLIDGQPTVYSVGPDLVDNAGQPVKGDVRNVLGYVPLPSIPATGTPPNSPWLQNYTGDWILYGPSMAPSESAPPPPAPSGG